MFEPTEKLTVCLGAAVWNQILGVLAEGPYRIVAPIINDIQAQCMGQRPTNLQQAGETVPDPVQNGHDTISAAHMARTDDG